MFTTNSETSLSDDEARHILVDYLEGRASLGEVQGKLKGHLHINFDLSTGQREIQDLDMPKDVRIPVHARHVRQMLHRYLDAEISNKDVSDWAAFVYMLAFYIPEGETEEERERNGESEPWEIIQVLADPRSVISLDFEKAQEFSERL